MSSAPIPSPLPDASASQRGAVSTGAQTFAGVKTFQDGISAPQITTLTTDLDAAEADIAALEAAQHAAVTLGAVGSSPNANGASLSGQVLTLQPADASNPGVVTTGAQTFAGAKTFSGDVSARTVAASVASGTWSFTFTGANGLRNPTLGAVMLDNAGLQLQGTAAGWTINTRLTSTVASGSVAIETSTGARWKLGAGTTDYLFSDGSTTIRTEGTLHANAGLSSFGFTAISGNVTCVQITNSGMIVGAASVIQELLSQRGNTAADPQVKIGSFSAVTAVGAKLVAFMNGRNGTEVGCVDKDGKGRFTGGIGVGNSAAGASLGTVTKKMEVFDAAGASLGFVPIYDAIT